MQNIFWINVKNLNFLIKIRKYFYEKLLKILINTDWLILVFNCKQNTLYNYHILIKPWWINIRGNFYVISGLNVKESLRNT